MNIQEMLLDRAGDKTDQNGNRIINKKLAIQLHTQVGRGILTSYFNRVDADSTVQILESGTIIRLLWDDDITWTNGAWTAPFDDTREFVRKYKNTEYPGNLLLTVELEGMPNEDMSPQQYQALLWLIRYWCAKYKIPMTRDYIIRHDSCGEHKYCPGKKVNDEQLFRDLTAAVDRTGGFKIGSGFLKKLEQLGHIALTNEQYFSPNADQEPGLTQRSFMWAKSPVTGETFIYLWFSGEGVRVTKEILT